MIKDLFQNSCFSLKQVEVQINTKLEIASIEMQKALRRSVIYLNLVWNCSPVFKSFQSVACEAYMQSLLLYDFFSLTAFSILTSAAVNWLQNM